MTDVRITRAPVTSSSIASLGYSRDHHVLEVEFRETGDVYRYFMVRPESYEALIKAESIGRYFNAEIRDKNPSRKM